MNSSRQQRKANKLAEARAADAAERAAIDEAERERKKEMEAFRAKMAGVNASSDGAASRAANGAAANGSTTHSSAGARGQTSTSGGSGGATAGAGVVGGVGGVAPITEVHKRVRGSNQPDPLPCPIAISPSPSCSTGPRTFGCGQMSMGESELRVRLRPVFERFDSDGSGAVSSAEMSAIISHLGMEVTAEQLSTLMTEADPDGSGEIDFDEVRHTPR